MFFISIGIVRIGFFGLSIRLRLRRFLNWFWLLRWLFFLLLLFWQFSNCFFLLFHFNLLYIEWLNRFIYLLHILTLPTNISLLLIFLFRTFLLHISLRLSLFVHSLLIFNTLFGFLLLITLPALFSLNLLNLFSSIVITEKFELTKHKLFIELILLQNVHYQGIHQLREALLAFPEQFLLFLCEVNQFTSTIVFSVLLLFLGSFLMGLVLSVFLKLLDYHY